MKCEKCKKSFNPRTDTDIDCEGGHEDTVEAIVWCPFCDASYSFWIEPDMWVINDGSDP